MTKKDWQLQKRSTGIPGLDELTGGGLPDSQATLVLGGSGTGKTILALQIIASAVARGGQGVFVSFEESSGQLKRNAASFSWGDRLRESSAWSLIDARTKVGAVVSGAFDIDALLAAIESKASKLDRPWVVVDGIDQLLKHQPDSALAVDQVRQISERCEKSGWTLLLTGKSGGADLAPRYLEGIEFLLPTTLLLSAEVKDRRLNRQLRVAKYRGTAHVSDEVPLVIDDQGIELPYSGMAWRPITETGTERITTGVDRLDDLLGGGIYKASSLLISGRPGTAKSTLAASLAEANAVAGHRSLLISFDELQGSYVRNLKSVGIDLQPQIDADRVRFLGLSAGLALVSEHMLGIRRLIESYRPQCLVIDPVSALVRSPGIEGSKFAVEWLIQLARTRGITTVLTALAEVGDPRDESTLGHASTIADTWLVLDYNVRGGERNRSISIVKSRGTSHSNQERELLLSSDGIDLADVYEYGSEVLMGTARAEKISEEKAAERRRALERSRHLQDLERRLEQARSELARLEADRRLLEDEGHEEVKREREHAEAIQRRRRPGENEKGSERGEES